MSIQILTPFLAAQIAAGEVVENAASAIKELVENSIDADSSTIKIQIANGKPNPNLTNAAAVVFIWV